MTATIPGGIMRNGPELTPPASPPLSRAYLRPNWFIQRENGAYVPVIPVDELPPEMDLDGAPRSLRIDDAQGMKFLDKLPFHGQTYSLAAQKEHGRADTAARRHKQRLYTTSQTSLRPLQLSSMASPAVSPTVNEHDPPTPTGHPPQPTHREPTATPASAPEKPSPGNGVRPLPPSGREPDQTKKEYCTYWIKTGECDFTQQGCLYKHEMPDLPTLRAKVGIHSVPHWYQVQSAMLKRSPTGNSGGGRSLMQPPSWLQERVQAADKRAAEGISDTDDEEEESGSDADDEEVVAAPQPKRKPLLQVPRPPPTTPKAAASPFRAPDDDVRRAAKRLPLPQTKKANTVCIVENFAPQHHSETKDLIDLSPPDTPPAPTTRPQPTALSSPKPLRKTTTATATTTPPRKPTTTTPSRPVCRISDTQANIFNLIRATSAPPPPVEGSKKKHKSLPVTAAAATSKSGVVTATAVTAARTGAAGAMKRYFPEPVSVPQTTKTKTATAAVLKPTVPHADDDDGEDEASTTTTTASVSLLPVRRARQRRAAAPAGVVPTKPRVAVPAASRRVAAAAAAVAAQKSVSSLPQKSAQPGLLASRHAVEVEVPSFEPRMVVGPGLKGGSGGKGRRGAVVAGVVRGRVGA